MALIRATTMGEALYAAALRKPNGDVARRIKGGTERAIVQESDTTDKLGAFLAREAKRAAKARPL